MQERSLSQHPVDVAIREILQGQRSSRSIDVDAVIERLASVTFKTGRRRLPQPLLALMHWHGYSTGRPMTELTFHWAKHALGDRQWSAATTETVCLEDLRRVVRHPKSRLLLRRTRASTYLAFVIADTVNVVPLERLGPDHGPEILVVYDAGIGKILSGYMILTSTPLASEPRTMTIWLRE